MDNFLSLFYTKIKVLLKPDLENSVIPTLIFQNIYATLFASIFCYGALFALYFVLNFSS